MDEDSHLVTRRDILSQLKLSDKHLKNWTSHNQIVLILKQKIIFIFISFIYSLNLISSRPTFGS